MDFKDFKDLMDRCGPMTLFERIDADLKEAMRAKNELELSTLRLIRTQLKNKQIEVMHPLSEEEAQIVVRSMVKQGKDALTDFTAANRQDLMDRQAKELVLLEKYLPAAMDEQELEAICREAVAQSGATSPSDMGKAMGAAMKIVAGRADGNRVKEIIQRLLTDLSP